jgi:hypothetical protein
LRISTASLDDEIEGLVFAAIDDMKMRGVDVDTLFPAEAETVGGLNPLAVRAAIYYAKANFGVSNNTAESEQYMMRYEGLTIAMSSTSDLRTPMVTINGVEGG